MASVGLETKGRQFDSLDKQKNVRVRGVNELCFPFPLHPTLKCARARHLTPKCSPGTASHCSVHFTHEFVHSLIGLKGRERTPHYRINIV